MIFKNEIRTNVIGIPRSEELTDGNLPRKRMNKRLDFFETKDKKNRIRPLQKTDFS